MRERIETIVIGGGQAGLATSYYLTREHREHVVLDQAARPAEAWRNHRWDSFTLNTPNWQSRLDGGGGNTTTRDPNGFMTRAEIVAYLEDYAKRYRLPVQYSVRVSAVKEDEGRGFVVETNGGVMRAKNVVVATGLYQKPRISRVPGALSQDVLQLHSDGYRNPGALPEGAVLVVGSAQSGAQIAEELYESGRKVYLSVSRSGRVPRRYRGQDVNWWSDLLGVYERTADQLPSPRARYAGKPHISGTKGGHTLNLHQFAMEGVTLVGHVAEVDGWRVRFARDLHENLAKADQFEAELTGKVDEYIKTNHLRVREEVLPRLTAGFAQQEIEMLDLKEAGVGTVLWATGYGFDFASMVRLPIFDADGFPVQRNGVTEYPGLYFVGLPWLRNAKSGILYGVSADAEYVVERIVDRDWEEGPACSMFVEAKEVAGEADEL